MSRTAYCCVLIASLMSMGCGGGGSSSAPPVPPAPNPTPPSIADIYWISASSFPVGASGGTVTIRWSYWASDVGGDMKSIEVDLLNENNNIIKQTTSPAGIAAGTTMVSSAFGSTDVPTTTAGTYRWRFRLVDAAGSMSNYLYSTYTVTP